MDDRQRYLAGWNASKRTRTYDLDAAESRHESRHGNDARAMFAAGWTDYAADREKFASLPTATGARTTYAGRDAQAETVDLTVCVDCVQLLANGEVTDSHGEDVTQEHTAKIQAVWGESFDITLGSLDCEVCKIGIRRGEDEWECEPWFSMSRCDGCHSDLGGDRQHATAWLATDAQGNDPSIPTGDRFDIPELHTNPWH